MNKQCALCAVELTSNNQSREHIIPNCIGGRRKTRDFICEKCNNEFGRDWEAALAEQMRWFSLSLGIVRERGHPPPMTLKTVDGRELLFRHDGSFTLPKPVYSEKDLGDGKIEIQLSARNEVEARTLARGIKRKYPKFDIETVLKETSNKPTYLDQPLHVGLEFGGPLAGRSMVKTATALASASGIQISMCGRAIAYLRDSSQAVPPPFGLWYATDLVTNRPQDSIFHCVAVAGIPSVKKILGYVEYFNFARILIELGDNFIGDPFYYSYSIDPTTGHDAGIQVEFSKVLPDLDKALSADSYTFEELKSAAHHCLPIVLKRNFERALTKAVDDAARQASEALGLLPDQELNADQLAQFTARLTQNLMPFIESRLPGRTQPRRRPAENA